MFFVEYAQKLAYEPLVQLREPDLERLAVGDVDGDGVEDLLIGAPHAGGVDHRHAFLVRLLDQ